MLCVKKIVGKLLNSSMYLLYKEGLAESWLIDIGDSSALVEELPFGMTIKGVLLTHTHFDHISGINELYDLFPNSKVYTSEYGVKCLYSSKKNFSEYHDQPIIFKGNDINILHDYDRIEIFRDEYITVIETPGHCASSLTYFSDDYLFTGDSYIPGFKVITKLPGGSKLDSELSLKKIQDLCNGRIVCPGHDIG